MRVEQPIGLGEILEAATGLPLEAFSPVRSREANDRMGECLVAN